MLIESVKEKMQFIEETTQRLGYGLSKNDYYIEDMGCPHKQPTKLPDGYAAVYIFIYKDEFLKIGKVNANSGPRFVSQHYGISTRSTLAKSLCSDERFVALGVNQENVKAWMLENLHRINVYIKADKAKTELVEAVLHYAFRPRYEGNI